MSVAYRSAASNQVSGVNNITVTKPSGTQQGDLLLAYVLIVEQETTFTTPSGWSVVESDTDTAFFGLAVFSKVAGVSEPSSYTFTTGASGRLGATVVALAGASGAAVASARIAEQNGVYRTPALTTPGPGVVLRSMAVYESFAHTFTLGAPPSGTPRATWDTTDNRGKYRLTTADVAGVETVSEDSWDSATTGQNHNHNYIGLTIAVGLDNQPPNAPTLTAPADGGTIDRTTGQTFTWAFSDPDAGDSQSAYSLRYRPVGGTWVGTGWQPSPTSSHVFPGGTFAAGDYEWQVATKDAQGVEGPWSASSYFTAATAPAAPTITDPANGATIATESYAVTWSTPDQAAYQVRSVADNAGAPDTATVYSDTGTVESATARQRVLDFPVNNRTEHLQVRIRHGGLWSTWSSVMVQVSYTQPAAPTVTLTALDVGAELLVEIDHPTPGTGQPAVTHADVYVDDGDGLVRKATNVPPGQGWLYELPVSGRDYAGHVQVVTYGDNGTTVTVTA